MDVGGARRYLRSIVEQARPRGYHRQADGTELFGRTPERGPEAWLHILFRPLTSGEVETLETTIGMPIPPVYREWLRHGNGVNLFADALSLDGLQLAPLRDPSQRQQYNLAIPNVYERPADAPADPFFIGGYSEDGSLLYIAGDDSIVRCPRDSAEAVASWDDLAAMLLAEVERLLEEVA